MDLLEVLVIIDQQVRKVKSFKDPNLVNLAFLDLPTTIYSSKAEVISKQRASLHLKKLIIAKSSEVITRAATCWQLSQVQIRH